MSVEHLFVAAQVLVRFVPTRSEFHDMFYVFPTVLEKILRPTLVYLFLVLGLRLAGKREIAQLNPFDLVVLLLLSNAVQNAMIGNDNSVTGGLIAAATLFAVNYFLVRFAFKHRRLDQIFEGRGTVLISGGNLRPEALAKELITKSELLSVVNRQGYRHLRDIERAILEPGGSFYLEGKAPPLDEKRHNEILERLDELSRQIQTLQKHRD